ncbi:NirA family protein [Spiribacter roseus]|uniref:NirA family protein n=1 Tax=Spiribacter roseus TaxID=1855875 RepID=A0ABV3RWB1_9GAMM
MSDQPLFSQLTDEQREYLKGFASGVDARREKAGLAKLFEPNADAAGTRVHNHPDALQLDAQERAEAAGEKLVPEEIAKRDAPPLDMWPTIRANAAEGTVPKGTEVFRYKYHGLFYTAPNQDAFMCRLRAPNGHFTGRQAMGIADVADEHAGGYAHVTTRANLQIREIGPHSTDQVLLRLQELGIITRGAGADNVRNITGDPLAGIDPQAYFDTRPLCREMHYHLINTRALYGLPRKFNIAFNGGGLVRGVSDTNDIDFSAVIKPDGDVGFQVGIGGIPGHDAFARATSWVVTPEQCVPVADAILRAYAGRGCRSDRKKARMKYVLDEMGDDAFMDAVLGLLAFQPDQFEPDDLRIPPHPSPDAHVGVHAQDDGAHHWIGVWTPFGYCSSDQLRGLGRIADAEGDGLVRLTVWQNAMIGGIPTERLEAVKAALAGLGLEYDVSTFRAGMVACTGNVGCKFSNTNTKRDAGALADYLEKHLKLDYPLNIHVTGCPNSCAQHKVADIGLLGTKVEPEDEDDEPLEGYHLYVGGGVGEKRGLGEKITGPLTTDSVIPLIADVLNVYHDSRLGPHESFRDFVGRSGTAVFAAAVK